MSTDPAPSIRPAAARDAATILGFVRELGEYEKLAHEAVATEAMIAQALFGPRPFAEALIAERGGVAVGFALFFHTFSTFVGKPGLYLEDIYVQPAHRRHGVGRALLRELAKIALARDCGRLECRCWIGTSPRSAFIATSSARGRWTNGRCTGSTVPASRRWPVTKMACSLRLGLLF